MSSFVRTSKYRHVFCEPPKAEACFSNLRLSTVTGEQSYIKSNGKFFALALQGGGGPFGVFNMNAPGKVANDHPVITGHTSAVLDFDFNPFHEHIIASASEDQTIKVWGIPEGGYTANQEAPLVDLRGHARKVTFVKFHPTANNVLASVSGDHSVKLWDVEKGSELNSLQDGHTDLIQDIQWDYEGNRFATSCKDKNVRICDARSARVTQTIDSAHEGAKSSKLAWLGSWNLLLTVGFTKQSMRQFKIWDPRNLSTELKKVDVDQAAGVILPFYDPDTSLLYLAGKGDGNIRYYEVAPNASEVYSVSDYRSSTSAKGMCWVPKTSLNVMTCETARLLKLTNATVEPLSFIVPRKSEAFQDDLFPETAGTTAAHSADEWFGGSSKGPVLVSLDPAKKSSGGAKTSSFVAQKTKTAAELQKELNAANARIAELEARLAAAGL